jgi:hypothetical protein
VGTNGGDELGAQVPGVGVPRYPPGTAPSQTLGQSTSTWQVRSQDSEGLELGVAVVGGYVGNGGYVGGGTDGDIIGLSTGGRSGALIGTLSPASGLKMWPSTGDAKPMAMIARTNFMVRRTMY